MSLWRRLGDSDAYGSCDATLGGQAAELKARPRLFPVSARESELPHLSDKWVPSKATGGHQNWGRGVIVASRRTHCGRGVTSPLHNLFHRVLGSFPCLRM